MKIDGGSGKRAEPVMLSEVAERLRNPRIDRIVASFREHRVSLLRSVLLGLVVVWTAAWLHGPVPMAVEAQRTLPVAICLFVLSVFWMLGVRAGSLRQNLAVEAVGNAANFLMVAVLLKSGFMLLISLAAVLPFLSVALGVRYSRKACAAGILASLTILAVVAPPGYWASRPAYALYALALVIVLPMTLYRMMDALREVSAEAIASREAQHRFADGDVEVIAEIGLSLNEAKAFVLSASLTVTMIGIDQETAEKLVRGAHAICPYSNAIRGNIDVATKVFVK